MVFESVFANLLNTYLSEFIDDVSASQLKLGAFKGNVSLKNLAVKSNALDSLHLPFRVIHGHIGSLEMKIPWMSLYTSPVVIQLKDVFAVCVPTAESGFDEKYEEQQIQAEKQRQLKNIDETIKKAALKNASPTLDESQSDDFTTKVVAQVIKNLQVTVENVHIRFEDDFTCPRMPFVVGFTLSQLLFQTDETLKSTKYNPSKPENCVFKMISLQYLSAYWNCNAEKSFVSKEEEENRDDLLRFDIANSQHVVHNLNYILEPNNFTAKTIINRKPEAEQFSMPLFDIDMLLDQLSLVFNRTQFESFVMFLDSINRMQVASMFRRWRPSKSLAEDKTSENRRNWWNFALESVKHRNLRRFKEWKWDHMRKHRENVRTYVELYKRKLKNENWKINDDSKIEELEKVLDVFNIVLSRNEAETTVRKEREQQAANAVKTQATEQKGWFSWLSWSAKETAEQKEKNIVDQFKGEMSKDEKLKFYQAIGYEETAVPTSFPNDFVAHLVNLRLKTFKFVVFDVQEREKILLFALDDVTTRIRHRPASNGLLIDAEIKSLMVNGCKGAKIADEVSRDSMLSVNVELNPLTKQFDYGISIKVKPLKIIFDALTVNTLLEIIRPPENVSLEEIQTLAAIKLNEFREMSVTGLEYAIEQHKQINANIDIEPSIVIVPEKGDIRENGNVLLVCVGKINMISNLIDKAQVKNIRREEMVRSESVIEKIREQSYEKYTLSISKIQMVLSDTSFWESDIIAIQSAVQTSNRHIIDPIAINLQLMRSIVSDDPDIPNIKVVCGVPTLNVKASEIQLSNLISLASSIPTTTSRTELTEVIESKNFESALVIRAKQANDARKAVEHQVTVEKKVIERQLTELMLNFSIDSLVIDLKTEEYVDILKLSVNGIGSSVSKQTFDLSADFRLKEIKLEAFDGKQTADNAYILLHTCQKDHLLKLQYDFCAQNSPTFKDTVQSVNLKMTEVTCSLSREVLTSLLVWSQKVMNRLPKEELKVEPIEENLRIKRRTSSIPSLTSIGLKPKQSKPKEPLEIAEIFNFVASFEIDSFLLNIDSICSVNFKRFKCDLHLTASEKIIFNALWEQFEVVNKVTSVSQTLVYDHIVHSQSPKVLKMEVKMFPPKDVEQKKTPFDIVVHIRFGRLRVVFLNQFVSELLSFLTVFETAKAAALNASSAAADYAKQSARSAYESATKIGFDIELEAPEIVVPRNWDSRQYLLLDLGKVVINNKVQTIRKVILDTINCELTSTRIAVIGDEMVTSFANILSPISFNVKIIRNLNFEEDKKEPELNISATLNDILLNIAQSDLRLVMQILSENIGAVTSPPVVQAAVTSVAESVAKRAIGEESSPRRNISAIAEVHVDADHETLTAPVHVRYHFDFNLPRITLVLFDGNTKTDETKLCDLRLMGLECYVVIQTDDTVYAKLGIANIVVNDVRKSRRSSGVTQIVYAKLSDNQTENEEKMISLNYTQKQDTFINVQMSGFTIILALDYILHVTKVITTGLAAPETSPAFKQTSSDSLKVHRSTAQSNEAIVQENAKPNLGLTVVDFKMSKMDVILIEKIDTSDCPAVILNSVVEVGLKQHDEHIDMSAKVGNIQLSLTNFEKYQKNNSDIEAYILQPTELNVHSSLNGPSQHFDIMLNEIKIHVSPNTVQVLLSILQGLGTTQDANSKVTEKREEINVKTFFLPKKITDPGKYWFLKSEISPAIEATEESVSSVVTTPVTPISSPFFIMQDVIITLNELSVIVESGGVDSQPMIKFESAITGRFMNWSKLDLCISCFIDYYNEKLYVWEPMIEPLENNKLWSFNVKVDIIEDADSNARYNATIESSDRLELTLTKASLNVLMEASDKFANAVTVAEALAHEDYVQVVNELGVDLFIFVALSKFKCLSTELSPRIENNMECIKIPSGKAGKFKTIFSEVPASENDYEINFRIIVDTHQIERSVSLRTKEKRCYKLPITSYPGKEWKYIIDMTHRDSNTKNIVFHSNVEITNKFHEKVELYYLEDTEIKLYSELKSQEKLFLPLRLVYNPTQKLFIKPHVDYCTPTEYITWEYPLESKEKSYFNMKCESKVGKPDFFIRVKQTVEDVLFEESDFWSAESIFFKFELLPIFKLRNLLPVGVKYSVDGISRQWSLRAGQEHDINYSDLKRTLVKIQIDKYLNQDWVAQKSFPSKWTPADQVDVWTYTAANGESVSMDLAVNFSTTDESGIRVASIFSPFWMINKTNLAVSYKVGDNIIPHEKDLTVPVLVCFKPKTLFSKKELSIAFEESKGVWSKWSDSFSIDAVGNKGTVVAKGKGKSKMSFCASIDIELSSFSLTKIVTVSPFYAIHNKTFFDIQVSEDNDEWIDVKSKKSKALWPKSSKDNKVYFRLSHDTVSSHPMSLEDTNSALLHVGDQLFNVHVEVTDNGVSVQVNNYFRGSAAVRIVNATSDLSIDFGQHCIAKRSRIPPMSAAYFTWYEPMLRRILVWSSPESPEMFLELDKDAFGEATNNLFWVTFLDAKQRILLITHEVEMAKNALHAGEMNKPVYSVEVSMRGMGISLVNNDIGQELLYIGIYSSGIVWEVAKSRNKKFKALSVKQNEIIEAAYQKEVLRRSVSNDLMIVGNTEKRKDLNLTNSLKVDFSNLESPLMIEPIKGILRRSSSLGFWCSVGLSEHVLQFHMKVNRIQIDNQADDCFFGIIMCPVTPPKSLTQDRAPKAFIEISALIQRQAYMNRFKILSVLVQEFLIQIDGDFVMSLSDLFANTKRKKEMSYEKMIKDDLKQAFGETSVTESDVALTHKNYFDLIHFSPIKVHVSFALGNAASFEILGIFDFLVKSAGVTLTEFKDVLFRIDYFEKKNALLSQEELTSLTVNHYMRQVLKQFYVVVLGLDVIGNPVGLFLGLKQGVGDFFYEPVVGIIEGPEEFAEGLAIGFKSLFSHTVGGAAGALGRITGTLSQGLSSLTMDEEDKRRRRETLNRNHSFAQSGKNLAKGFLSGVTGLVTKPLQGAKNQGFEGFVKGVGRGVVGVVAQPATGVIDFASGSLNAFQKAIDVNAEAKKQRLARHIHKDGVIRPYNSHEAKGRSILRDLNKGEFSESDVYIAHGIVGDGIVLVSDKNVFYLKRGCVFKNIEIEWNEAYENIANVEIVNGNDIRLSLKVSD